MDDVTRLAMLTLERTRVRVVLDTDTYNEIDDQFALVQMMLSPERLNVEAIYAAPFANERAATPGEGMEQSYDEILRLLERLDRSADGLVFHGASRYVGAPKQSIESEAVEHLIETARSGSTDDPLYVIAIAALTNIASAILKAPDIVDKMVVVWLGGHAINWPDINEFNLRQDVGAAQVVFDAGVPLVLVPCRGVTTHLSSTVPEIECYVEPHGQIGRFLAKRFKEYTDERVGWSKPIWDMAAVAFLIDDSWTPNTLLPTPIVTDNMTWSVDASRPLMRYVYYVDRDPVFRDFFNKLANQSLKRSKKN